MLQREDIAQQTHRELEGQNYALIEGLQLPPHHFRTQRARNTTNLLLVRTQRGYFHVYLDEAVEYLGSDLPRALFTNETREGWRRLNLPNDGTVQSTLGAIDAVLGLDGTAPHLPTIGLDVQREAIDPPQEVPSTRSKPDPDDALAKFGKDLTALAVARKLSPVIGREREMAQVIRTLLKHGKNAPLLIGEPGVGKSAVVEGLAQRIVAGTVVEQLRSCRIVEINLGFLTAGASMKGELEERVEKIIATAKADPNLILFFDELHTICTTWGDNEIATLLKSDLARGTFKVIGATTYRDFKGSIEKDGALARRFQQVLVSEPMEEETIAIQ